jgi:hypothetical protein
VERPPLQIPLRGLGTLFAWRITDTVVEQLPVDGASGERAVVIENPDRVELIVLGGDASLGATLMRQLRGHAMVINQQRWLLVRESLSRCRDDWQAAVGGGLVPRTAAPYDLLEGAARQLLAAQQALASGQWGAAGRAIRAADAMGAWCEATLRNRVVPADSEAEALPTLAVPGGLMLHLAWLPGLEDGRWSRNLLAEGALQRAERLPETGWTYETRLDDQARASVEFVEGGGVEGRGALRVETVARGPQPLPGGYAGTVARVRSAPLRVQPGRWLQIRVTLKTLGFGGPHQGVLIYDSDAGSELGRLVRNQSDWGTIELYRIVTRDQPLRIVAETIGGGQAMIDRVEVRQWMPPRQQPRFQPLTER